MARPTSKLDALIARVFPGKKPPFVYNRSRGEIVIDRFTKETKLVMTIDVRISRKFQVRLWVAKNLVALAALVLGCVFEVENDARSQE